VTDIEKTRCPHCKSAFRVTSKQLTAARGMVRCGVCFRTFNARAHLESDLAPNVTSPADEDIRIDDNFDLSRLSELGDTDQAEEETSPPPRPTPRPEIAQPAADQNRRNGEKESLLQSIPQAAETELDIGNDEMAAWQNESEDRIDSTPKSELPRQSRRNGLWLAGSLIALLAFTLQLLYFNSLQINRDSPLWSVAQPICSLIGCPLQEPTDLARITTGDLLIRTHPTVANALFVDAVIVNQANFSQPFPRLRLIFENLQGETVAYRTFAPEEYLGGELANSHLMPPRRPVKLELEIVDPGKDAVSFRLLVEK
jgi:predicted Zn finger-like uncharacterized protein